MSAAPAPAAGVKHDAGKLRFDLLPVEPLRELARVYTIGAAKYADRNWERGLSWGRVFAAMCRHAFAWWGGERLDPVDGQHHLASVAWCALALIEYERTHPELDDRAASASRSTPAPAAPAREQPCAHTYGCGDCKHLKSPCDELPCKHCRHTRGWRADTKYPCLWEAL